MANRVIYQFIASDRFSAVAEKMAAKSDELSGRIAHLKTESIQLAGVVDRVSKGIRNRGLALIGAGLAFGAAQTPFLKQFAKIEQLQVAFEQIVGSVEEGDRVFKKLQAFQRGTPFDLIAIKTAGQTLLTFGTDVEDLELQLTALGNIAAATGKPIEDLALTFGKAQTQGRVSLDVVNQFAIRGVNLLEMWAERSGKSVDDVREAITKGQVPFALLRETILDLAGREGGRFTGIMEEQAQRLAGAWQRFTSSVTLAKAAIGGILSEAGDIPALLNTVTRWILAATDSIKGFAEEHPQLMRFIVRFGAVLIVVGALMVAFSQAMLFLASIALPILIFRLVGFQLVLRGLIFLFPLVGILIKGLVFLFGALATSAGLLVLTLLLIPAAIILSIRYWREILAVQDAVFAAITNFVQAIPGMVSAMVEGIGAKILDLKGRAAEFLSEGPVGKVLEFLGVEIGGAANVSVDVNLSGPPGSVESTNVETQSSGSLVLDSGLNMNPGLA